ncbi:MAG: hypothetical protein IPO49_09920 [Bacteroidetes bacterium]|nr:hypothetical protein [Bacteroidota bacterium]
MLVNDNKKNIPSILFSSIIKHIGSFIIGCIITFLVYYFLRKGFYNFFDSMLDFKPLARTLFDWGILALTVNFILIAGKQGSVGVLKIFGTRHEDIKLTEGYTWLGPSFIFSCDVEAIESLRSMEIIINSAKLSRNLIHVSFNVAYTYNVKKPIVYFDKLKSVDKIVLKSRLEESIRDLSISMEYLQAVVFNGRDLSNLLIDVANEKVREDWGIEIQTASVNDIRTENPALLNIYARFNLEIREKLLELDKKQLDFNFIINSIESIIDKFKIELKKKEIIDLLNDLIGQFRFNYNRYDINMDENTRSFVSDILGKVKDKFSQN